MDDIFVLHPLRCGKHKGKSNWTPPPPGRELYYEVQAGLCLADTADNLQNTIDNKRLNTVATRKFEAKWKAVIDDWAPNDTA